MMRRDLVPIVLCAAAGLAIAAPGAAAEFKVELASPQGRVLKGRNGLHAADSRTDRSLVRIISPGSDIGKRGTIRVLVMNLGTTPFDFGPANVRLELADGSTLAHVPLAEFDKGRALIERESGRAASVARRTEVTALAEAGAFSGVARSINAPAPGGGGEAAAAGRHDRNRDADMLPGMKTLRAIDGVLRPGRIAPQEADGGYLVFNLPKALRSLAGNHRLTVVVRTGSEEHRFEGWLRRQ